MDRSAGMTRHKAELPKHFQSVHVSDVRNQHPLQATQQPHFALEGASRGFSTVDEGDEPRSPEGFFHSTCASGMVFVSGEMVVVITPGSS